MANHEPYQSSEQRRKLEIEKEAKDEAKDITFRAVMMSLPVIALGCFLFVMADWLAKRGAGVHSEPYWSRFLGFLGSELVFIVIVVFAVWALYRIVLYWQIETREESSEYVRKKEDSDD